MGNRQKESKVNCMYGTVQWLPSNTIPKLFFAQLYLLAENEGNKSTTKRYSNVYTHILYTHLAHKMNEINLPLSVSMYVFLSLILFVFNALCPYIIIWPKVIHVKLLYNLLYRHIRKANRNKNRMENYALVRFYLLFLVVISILFALYKFVHTFA